MWGSLECSLKPSQKEFWFVGYCSYSKIIYFSFFFVWSKIVLKVILLCRGPQNIPLNKLGLSFWVVESLMLSKVSCDWILISKFTSDDGVQLSNLEFLFWKNFLGSGLWSTLAKILSIRLKFGIQITIFSEWVSLNASKNEG